MDKKDERILLELILNSRIPLNRLAKKVGLSREVVNYRLSNLIKQKIIKEFYTIIDFHKLGFSKAGCLFQLKGISKEKEKEILDYLVKHKFVTYLGPLIGKWNFAFDIVYKDKEQLSSIIKGIEKKISKFLDKFVIISSGLKEENFPTKILGIIKQNNEQQKFNKSNLDEIDLNILSILSNNSRIEYTSISDKICLTANAIKQRIQKMEKAGVITGYTLSIDFRKLQFEMYNLQIKKTHSNKEEELKKFLRNNKRVIYFYEHLGNENWDLDIGVLAKSSEELREFILELREKFGEFIKINDLYIIVEESKGNYVPEGVFKQIDNL